MRNDNEVEHIAENLCKKIDNALNGHNVPQIKEKNIEYFFNFENNMVNYFFVVPGAKKEDLKVTIEQDENLDYVNIVLTKYDFCNRFKNVKSFMQKSIEKISIVKESFNFENVQVNLNDGILKLSLEVKNKTIKKENNIIMTF
jgi:HSP20 family molecular chaperone IbpA